MQSCRCLCERFRWDQPFYLKTHDGVTPSYCQRQRRQALTGVANAAKVAISCLWEGIRKERACQARCKHMQQSDRRSIPAFFSCLAMSTSDYLSSSPSADSLLSMGVVGRVGLIPTTLPLYLCHVLASLIVGGKLATAQFKIILCLEQSMGASPKHVRSWRLKAH